MPRLLSFAAMLVTASFLLPALASAEVLPANNSAEVDLGHGLSFHSDGRHASVDTFHLAFAGRSKITSYSAGARTDRTGVVARFGELGHVDLDFEPSGPPSERKNGSHCHGGPELTWEGLFTGTVEVRGRYGLRSVRDRSFARKGSFSYTPRMVCKIPQESEPHGPESGKGVLLSAEACDGTGFTVEGERQRAIPGPNVPGSIFYEGHATIRDGGVTLFQDVIFSAASRTFTFDEALTTATVSPPSPFDGKGTFVREPDGSTEWSGTLSVNLLGRQIPLTGPKFASRLESFRVAAGAGQIFVVGLCRRGKGAAASGGNSGFPLLRPHLGALLPSGAR